MTHTGSGWTELTGADWFLVAVERMMRQAGQGEHVGLTVLELGPGLDLAALQSAMTRLAAASPIAKARLHRRPFSVPRWEWRGGRDVEFPVQVHPAGTHWEDIGTRMLQTEHATAIGLDVVPGGEGNLDGNLLLLRWRHSLVDGKGAELLLAELARLATDPGAAAQTRSWGSPLTAPPPWRAQLGEAKRFKDHYYALAARSIRALGDTSPQRCSARFHVERFTGTESARIAARAADVSRGMFQLGWCLAIARRAHRRVLAARGQRTESFQASCAVQERKRGARHPIWQNHVSQLFFSLGPEDLDDLPRAASLLHEQFSERSRQRLDAAFAANARLFRYAPAWFWLQTVKKNSGGYVTSFFFSHTGECLQECRSFCGAPIRHAWHIPTVSQPPGTGIFFGQREGRLTATFSWRDGVLRDGELDLLRTQAREDLLGP